jgi:DNA end-binding protein Ku
VIRAGDYDSLQVGHVSLERVYAFLERIKVPNQSQGRHWNHEDEVAKPEAFEDEAPQVELSAEEQKLTKMLVDASTAKKFDFAKYKDAYTEKLIELINAKVAGKEIVASPVHEQAQIINLMDALRQSVEQAQKPAAGEAAGKPPKKMAPSVRKRERSLEKKSG